MSLESPKVDILLATYNGEKYIHEQIASLQCQTYTNWNLLVSDDGSTDGTLSIVEEIQKIDDRVKIVATEAGFHSSSGNFLSLLKQSNAPYAMFCDQDDVWLEDKVEKSLNVMLEVEKNHAGAEVPSLVFTDSVVVDSFLECLRPSFVAPMCYDPKTVSFSQSIFRNVTQGATTLINRPLIEIANSIEMPEVFENHDYWIAMIARAIGVVSYIDSPTLLYRQHEENAVGATKSARSVAERLASIKKTLGSMGWKDAIDKIALDGVKLPIARAQYLSASKLFKTEEQKNQLEAISAMANKNAFSKLVTMKKLRILDGWTLYEKANEVLGVLRS